VFLDLGTNIVAGSNPFEIHVKRKSYHDPITATQTIRPGQTRTLPAGLVQDFRGFSHFLHLTLTDAAGGKVVDRDQVFCPNDWEAVRTRPDAPPTSPYPQLCGPHPFTLGWVWGIQAGWAASTTLSDFEPLGDLPDGTYTAKVRVNQPYQQLFGIPPARASATVKVTIRTRTDGGVGAVSAAPRTRASSPRPASRPAGRARVPARFRPDLRPLPAWGIGVIGPEEAGVPATGPQQYLAFSANVWNAGPSPLVVDGFRRPGTLLMDAYQYFFDRRALTSCTDRAAAGQPHWPAAVLCRTGSGVWSPLARFARRARRVCRSSPSNPLSDRHPHELVSRGAAAPTGPGRGRAARPG